MTMVTRTYLQDPAQTKSERASKRASVRHYSVHSALAN